MFKKELIRPIHVDAKSNTNEKQLKELRDCMQCKYFHENNSQCIKAFCNIYKEETKIDEKDFCYRCPYKDKDGKKCFPCMWMIFGQMNIE